ncbi:MAG: GNAT family N-acetyltransferase [Bacteroidota bacterium]
MSDPITVRRARPGDLEAALRLWAHLDAEQARLDSTLATAEDARALWSAEFRALVGTEAGGFFVAVVDGAVAGLVTARLLTPPPLYASDLYAFIDELVVDPAARQRGVGARLVDAVRDWAREQGVLRVEARVVAGNSGALDFWGRAGAEEVARTVRLKVS